MLRRSLLWFVCILLFSAVLVLGTESASPEAEPGTSSEQAGEPDIFSGTWGTAILTLGIFIVLLAVLGKWAWGPILAGLQKREEHIRQSIEDAEQSRLAAEQALEEYKAQLAQARSESQGIIDQGRSEAVKLAEELKQGAQAEAQKLRAQAQRDIHSAKEEALRDLCDQTCELATDIAGKILQRSLTPQDHRDLVAEALNKLQTESKN